MRLLEPNWLGNMKGVTCEGDTSSNAVQRQDAGKLVFFCFAGSMQHYHYRVIKHTLVFGTFLLLRLVQSILWFRETRNQIKYYYERHP